MPGKTYYSLTIKLKNSWSLTILFYWGISRGCAVFHGFKAKYILATLRGESRLGERRAGRRSLLSWELCQKMMQKLNECLMYTQKIFSCGHKIPMVSCFEGLNLYSLQGWTHLEICPLISPTTCSGKNYIFEFSIGLNDLQRNASVEIKITQDILVWQ